MRARHLKIFGHVQGVCYRDGAVTKARQLGLTGWVRNCGDGSVEALVAGEPAGVEAFIEWAWEGPPAAQVDHIEIKAQELEAEPTGFVRLPTHGG